MHIHFLCIMIPVPLHKFHSCGGMGIGDGSVGLIESAGQMFHLSAKEHKNLAIVALLNVLYQH